MDPLEVARRARRTGGRAAALASGPVWTRGAPLPVPPPLGLSAPADVLRRAGVGDPRRTPVALLFAGGARHGAYLAGVLAYLAEQGVPVTAVAGTGAGALAAALVAAEPALLDAADRLHALWPDGGPADPDGSADDTVRQHVDPARLRAGRPLYTSAFRSLPNRVLRTHHRILAPHGQDHDPAHAGPGDRGHAPLRLRWSADPARAPTSLRRHSHWRHVNSLPEDRMAAAVRDGAALPTTLPPPPPPFPSPPPPTAAPAGAARRVLVIHLGPGPLADRLTAHGGDAAVEVFPRTPLAPGPGAAAAPGADLHRRGHEDARAALEPRWREALAPAVAEAFAGHRAAAVAELGLPLPELPIAAPPHTPVGRPAPWPASAPAPAPAPGPDDAGPGPGPRPRSTRRP
ncbi:patatin-like phospholipase family protein [Streptomyces sp. NPDC004244]